MSTHLEVAIAVIGESDAGYVAIELKALKLKAMPRNMPGAIRMRANVISAIHERSAILQRPPTGYSSDELQHAVAQSSSKPSAIGPRHAAT